MGGRTYFAYGSNINLTQMSVRCPNAVVLGPTVLNGYELTFRSSGVATIMPREGAKVHGLLWRITPECEHALDSYEGFPTLYGKKTVVLTDGGDLRCEAMVYVMTRSYLRTPALPPTAYFEGIRRGYEQNGMDTAPLYEALDRVRAEVREQALWKDFVPLKKALSRKPRHKKFDR